MRQRKAKNLDERMDILSGYMVKNPGEMRGHWQEAFVRPQPLYLELGCGKGKFLRTQALEHPDRNYIGIEGQPTVVLHAMERCEALRLEKTGEPSQAEAGARNESGMFSNMRFACDFVKNLADYFEKGELAGMYLNFSDPWPKPRHAKRRLTYRGYLAQYAALLNPGSFIEIKTDNDGLFNFTLSEAKALPEILEIAVMSRDLHSDESLREAAAITTEYEDKFKGLGKNINYVKLRVSG